MSATLALASAGLAQDAWLLLHFHSPLALFFFFLLGGALGSFANVVIWRFPRKESLLKPASHCLHCETPIPPKYNIPVLSYFLLRGRSACCGQVIPIRYPVVEFAGVLTTGALYWLYGLSLEFLFAGVWMLLLIILAGIDLEHFRLPNLLVGLAAVFSLIFQIVAPQQDWTLALWGALVGLCWSGLTLMIGKILKGRLSGVGDLKLAVVLGFAFGPGKFIFLYMIASVAALIYALLRLRSLQEKRIPMGPFFALGTYVAILWGDEVLRWYMRFFY
ncbi:MAG: prepilin peptidase [bacterium]|nr:prepilin peptidase [bacterium]